MSCEPSPLSFIDSRFGTPTLVRPEFANYGSTGALALMLVIDGNQKGSQDGEPWAHASVNVPPQHPQNLEHGELAIKNWSENMGLADLMVKAGILKASEKMVDHIPVHMLTVDALELADPFFNAPVSKRNARP